MPLFGNKDRKNEGVKSREGWPEACIEPGRWTGIPGNFSCRDNLCPLSSNLLPLPLTSIHQPVSNPFQGNDLDFFIFFEVVPEFGDINIQVA